MNNFAFTICAKNYLGLAEVMCNSIIKNNPEIKTYIIIADYTDRIVSNHVILSAKDNLDIPTSIFYEMAFKYDITEFCTALKPFAFDKLLNFEENKIGFYFDPDIFILGNLNDQINLLKENDILLTPHLARIEPNYTGNLEENKFLFSGIYNLGFLGLKKSTSSSKLLEWWKIRLKNSCYQDMNLHLFTDQKWIDFIPSFFYNTVCISNNIGLNVAPWNLHERKIIEKSDKLLVQDNLNNQERLIFYHFSGYDYNLMIEDINHFSNNLEFAIIKKYSIELKESNFQKYISFPYQFNSFTNGRLISKIHRRLYAVNMDDFQFPENNFNHEQELYLKFLQKNLINDHLSKSDKKNLKNLPNKKQKLKVINSIFKILFKLLGPNKFFLIIRGLRHYSKIETYSFLIK